MLEAALFIRKLASNFLIFFTFPLHFMLDLGPNPVPEPELECITVPDAVALRQKVAVRFLS